MWTPRPYVFFGSSVIIINSIPCRILLGSGYISYCYFECLVLFVHKLPRDKLLETETIDVDS